MGTMRSPDYVGGGLVNLVAEIEQRLSGGSVSPGLTPELAASIPNAETYVFVLFDGLGDLQIASHEAERLASRGAEAVVVEPAIYLGGPLDRVLYRGAQTRGVEEGSSIAEAALEEASRPGRLVICYLPHVDVDVDVDVAAHATGTGSGAYVEALRTVTNEWQTIGEGLPSHAALIGTADHGMVDVAPEDRIDLHPH